MRSAGRSGSSFPRPRKSSITASNLRDGRHLRLRGYAAEDPDRKRHAHGLLVDGRRLRLQGRREAGAADAGDAYSDEAATPDAVAPSRAPETSPEPPFRPGLPVAQAETVESYEATGSNGSAVFVVLAADPLEAVRLEALRRQNLLVAFVDGVGGSWSVPAGTGSAAARKGPFRASSRFARTDAFPGKAERRRGRAIPRRRGRGRRLGFQAIRRSRHLLFLERRVLDPFRPGRFQPSQMVQFPLQTQSLGPRPRRRFRLAGESRRASRRSADRGADPAAGDGVAHGLRAIHRGRLGLRRARNTEGRESLPRGRHEGRPRRAQRRGQVHAHEDRIRHHQAGCGRMRDHQGGPHFLSPPNRRRGRREQRLRGSREGLWLRGRHARAPGGNRPAPRALDFGRRRDLPPPRGARPHPGGGRGLGLLASPR